MVSKKVSPAKAAVKKATPRKKPQAKKEAIKVQSTKIFPIVGIGASAGGLEAFEGFFKAMPADAGIAFVLVAHLDPKHISILPELIQKRTGMKVLQVTDNLKIVPNRVYIIPPNRQMAILNGTLQLLEIQRDRGLSLPIDIFLRSLAQDQRSNSIGIILSGTGTDGTQGIKAIKVEGGMVMAQDTESAKYDGMPSSAAATGLVDYIISPDKMPEQLLKYVHHQGMGNKDTDCSDECEHGDSMTGALQKIFILLRSATGNDFSLYKKNTICRRIERRMQVHQLDRVEDYVRYLQESEREVLVLFQELLIGVTSFFRDPEAFDLLKTKYLKQLLEDRPDNYQIRIWVPGCSTGEEVYSIAMIVQECMDEMNRHFSVQIFGTDLDEEAIHAARAGIYPESVSVDVSQERLHKFFVKDANSYQIKKNIRDLVVFATQNVIKDPPFTKLDLLCCRNLLIYFGTELQNKLLPIFHYSLKPGGFLFLGSSETIGQAVDLFTLLEKKWKIFERHPAGRSAHPVLEFSGTIHPPLKVEKDVIELPGPPRDLDTIKLLKVILAQSNMPACVVIDDTANIIYIHGRTGRFLEPAEGETSVNILEMARPGLRAGLTNAIRRMGTERQEIVVKGLQVKNNGGFLDINLIVKPLTDLQTGRRGMMMVIFDEVTSGEGHDVVIPAKKSQSTKSVDVKRLEDELLYTRENLQTTIEELETSNEELKSTNEELQSTNEELQSTNEEMETSKEELQSLNEESTTVNSELQARISELMAANDDIKNLLDATNIATIFLDIDLNIRRFTPRTTDFFYLTLKDVGRSISHFATTLKGVDLQDIATKVLLDLGQYELDVEDNTGKRYRMRARPYRTINNVIDGVVVTFENITEYITVVQALTETEEKWRGVVENVPLAIFVVVTGGYSYVNPFAVKMFGAASEEEFSTSGLIDRVHPDNHDFVGKRINRLLQERKTVPAAVEKLLRMDGSSFEMMVSGVPISSKGEDAALIFAQVKW